MDGEWIAFRSSIPVREEQLFNLKFQWILKEMQQKSQIIGNLRRTTSGLWASRHHPLIISSPFSTQYQSYDSCITHQSIKDRSSTSQFYRFSQISRSG